MRGSRGLKWGNKTYKLKRSIKTLLIFFFFLRERERARSSIVSCLLQSFVIEVNICAVMTILRWSYLFEIYNVGWYFVFSGSVCPAHRPCAQCCAVHRAEKEGIANILKPLSIVIHIVTSCNLELIWTCIFVNFCGAFEKQTNFHVKQRANALDLSTVQALNM